MSLIEIHARLANTVLFYVLIMTAWGLWRFFRKEGPNSSYWGAMIIAEILFLVQAGLGAFLWLSGIGQLQGRWIHILYGVVSVLVVPGVFLYVHGEELQVQSEPRLEGEGEAELQVETSARVQRRAMLVYGVSFLFLVGIVLRAMATAG